MMKKQILFIAFVFITIASFSQNTVAQNTYTSKSIYTMDYNYYFKTTYIAINKKFNIKSNKLNLSCFQNVNYNIANASNTNYSKAFIELERDIKDYKNTLITKEFLFKNDPTQWPLCAFLTQNRFD